MTNQEVTPSVRLCTGCGSKSWGVEPDECMNCGSTEFEEQEVDLVA